MTLRRLMPYNPDVTAADILDLTRALIQDPDDWIQGLYCGRTLQSGEVVGCTYENADRFCLDGAVVAAAESLGTIAGAYVRVKALHTLDAAILDIHPNIGVHHRNHNGIRTYINDVVGHKAVMMALDIACARARRIEEAEYVLHQKEMQRLGELDD